MTTHFIRKIIDSDNYSLNDFVMDCTSIVKSVNTRNLSVPFDSFYNESDLEEATDTIAKIERNINTYKRMTINEAKIMMIEEYRKLSYDLDEALECINDNDKYKKMLQEIEKWKPEEEDYKYLKKFCISELKAGIKECERRIEEYSSKLTDPISVEDWINKKISTYQEQLCRWKDKYDNMNKKREPFKAWISGLEDSLNKEKE